MAKKIIAAVFWLSFFGLFTWMAFPKLSYISDGIPAGMGKNSLSEKIVFAIHIFFGLIVYVTAVLQFTPAIRSRYIQFHRNIGKLFIAASLICITSLYLMIPDGLCAACRPSHYFVTSLWLIFIVTAFYLIKQKRIEWHRRFMISSFICAAYFVSVRLVDRFAMSFFRSVTKTEDQALLVSDISVWLVPLLGFWSYWLWLDKGEFKTSHGGFKK